MTSYIIYGGKNFVCRENAALAAPPPSIKHVTHDVPDCYLPDSGRHVTRQYQGIFSAGRRGTIA